MYPMDGRLGEYESMDEFEFLDEGAWTPEAEAVFDEIEEMELAASLLEITDEQEMEEFLGKLIKSAGKAVGGFVKGPVGQALGGALKSVARVALPMAGTALGNLVAPGIGGVIGGKLAGAAGRAFGLELEGMSPQDQEFEVARRFVRLAGESVRNAAEAPAGAPASTVAKDAVLAAAQQHAPGLVAGSAASGGVALPRANGNGRGNGNGASRPGSGKSGRWGRRGSNIVLFGV